MTIESLFTDKDDTLLIRKELVRVLGDLNEAVFLNQLHYWLEINRKANKNFRDGRYWVYNSYPEWQKRDFDFWSVDTIKRVITKLEKKGIVISANYNKLAIDRTKWYSIDYEKLLESLETSRLVQNAPTMSADCPDEQCKLPSHIPKNTTIDYNTENNFSYSDSKFIDNTLSYTNNKSIEKINTHFPEGKEQRASKNFSKRDYDTMVYRLEETMQNFKDIAEVNSETEIERKNITECFEYYIRRYHDTTGRLHPALEHRTQIDIFNKLSRITDYKYNHFESVSKDERKNYLIDMVDVHFNAKHRQETNWHISHFMNEKYLWKLAHKVIDCDTDYELPQAPENQGIDLYNKILT